MEAMDESQVTRQGFGLGCTAKALILFAGTMLAMVSCGFIHSQWLYGPIDACDKEELLQQCRTLHEQHQKAFLNDPCAVLNFSEGEYPGIFHEIGVRRADATKDFVHLYISRFPQVHILAFAEGAEQFGGEKLLDGLWMSSNLSDDYWAAHRTRPKP